MRRVVLATLATLLLTAAPASAQEGPVCTGETSAAAVEPKDGPALRYGITPSGAAGQLGPLPADFEPDRIDAMLAKLELLMPPRGPFVAHVYSSWRDAGEREDARLVRLGAAYASIGMDVEYVLRYRPDEGREGDVAGYVEWVRHMVRTLGQNPRAVAFQIANEVNFTASPDSSDGAYARAREALVEGVVAAREESQAIGRPDLEVGFNWVYRMDTASERVFWEHLRDHGGERFVRALSFVGLDFYPGTFFPPAAAPGTERDFAVNALTLLRNCYLPTARIPESVPIHVQETGYPTGAGRTWERQAEAMETIVRAFHDFRGTFNVSDLRWFNMRDAQTGSPNFQQQYGLLTDDYEPKPAFETYRALVRDLSRRDPAHPAEARPRVRIPGGRPRGCARRSLVVFVDGAAGVERVDFLVGGRRLASDGAEPFRRRVSLRRARPGVRRIAARLHYPGGGRATIAGPRVRICARR
jgi:hypothetical protein